MGVRVCTVWRRFAWSDVCRPELGRPHRKVGRGSMGTQRYRLLLICLLPGPMCTARARTFLAERWDRGSTGGTAAPFASPPVFDCPPLCARSSRASGHPLRTQGGFIASHLYIYIYMSVAMLTKNAHLSRLRAERNSVEFYFLFFLCFLCF